MKTTQSKVLLSHHSIVITFNNCFGGKLVNGEKSKGSRKRIDHDNEPWSPRDSNGGMVLETTR